MAASAEELEVEEFHEKAEEFQEQLPTLDNRKVRMSYLVKRKPAAIYSLVRDVLDVLLCIVYVVYMCSMIIFMAPRRCSSSLD